MIQFKEWPKTPRWENEKWTITEKIDGTNAAIIIDEHGEVSAQSRSRIITPEDDNFGFAAWVKAHKNELLQLGVGHHFGEWWGSGIQRHYGMKERIFSLFSWWQPDEEIPSCCRKVPVIGQSIEKSLNRLKEEGSIAAPGYMDPEGLVIYSRQYHQVKYKLIME